MEKLSGTLSGTGLISGSLNGRQLVSGSVSVPSRIGVAYAGPYEVTPGDDQITLATDGTYATRDIIINPIPNNYGRIAWNGSVLTVS